MAERIMPSNEVVQVNIKKWKIPQPDREYTVLIHCSTYNHGKYIKDALEGFVMQKCSFPFCAIVIDDGSTDNNAEIIREYTEKYPDIIKPILLEENHMQRGILRDPYFERWHQSAKYIAYCEGDDYWCDPLKLQKQVALMELYPNLSQCFTAHRCLYPDGHFVEEHRYYADNICCPVKDAILNGGGYMATPTVLYRRESRENMPEWSKNLPIGDLPSMLVLFERGDCGYINDVTAVYRVSAIGSWSNSMKASYTKKMQLYSSINRMWKEYNKWTNKRNHKWVRMKILRNNISKCHDKLKNLLNKYKI